MVGRGFVFCCSDCSWGFGQTCRGATTSAAERTLVVRRASQRAHDSGSCGYAIGSDCNIDRTGNVFRKVFMKVAVSVKGLSKSYTIAHNQASHSTLAETVLHRMKNPFERAE